MVIRLLAAASALLLLTGVACGSAANNGNKGGGSVFQQAMVAATQTATATAAPAVAASATPTAAVSATKAAASVTQAAPASATRASAPPPIGEPDACKLVTQDEADAAVGQKLQAPTRHEAVKRSECTYKSADGSLSLTAGIRKSQPGSSVRMVFDATRKLYGPSAEDAAGVGDAAYVDKALGVIEVLKGDKGFTIQLVNLTLLGTDELKQKLIDLAKKAVGRL